MLVLGCALLALAVVSIYMSLSGYLPGRTHIGWAFLAAFIAGTAVFGVIWFSRYTDAVGQFLGLMIIIVLLASQSPLAAELVSQGAVPDGSKGLKLLNVHTSAERMVIEDDLPGAIAEFERIIENDPEDYPARFRMAEVCCQAEDYRKAVAAYEALLEYAGELSRDQHCLALTRLADIYANNLGDTANARRCIHMIIEKYPNTSYAGHARARLANL
jgi:tetratricopeptide (TPR) repeat protein